MSGSGGDSVNKVVVRTNVTGGYAAGISGLSSDGGTTWQTLPGQDVAFKEGQYPWFESFTTSNTAVNASGLEQVCQTFTPSTTHYLNYVSLYLYKIEYPTYQVTIALYSADASHKPTGAALCSTTFDAWSLTTAAAWYDFRFDSGCQVNAGTEYAIVISSMGDDTTSKVIVRLYTANGYASGQRGYSADGGTAWTMVPTQDMAFREGGWL